MTQRVFITGGASGLGRAIALRYAKEGAKVCIGDINPEQGVAVEAELNQAGGEGYFVECDVRRLSDFEKVRDDLVQKWGGVDVVVNNAGVASAGSIEDTTIGDWEWILDINVLGVVRGCKAFTPLFKQQGSGAFVNVAHLRLNNRPHINSGKVLHGFGHNGNRIAFPRCNDVKRHILLQCHFMQMLRQPDFAQDIASGVF